MIFRMDRILRVSGPARDAASLLPNGAIISHSLGQATAPPWVPSVRRFCPVRAASQTSLPFAPFRPVRINNGSGPLALNARNPDNPAYPVKRSAFSLIEVVLALAVIAFAITGIMGLFPVALKSAQESQRETRATFIAQQIFNDLKASPRTNLLISTGSDLLDSGNFVTPRPSFTNAWSNIVSFDLAGAPIGVGTNTEAIYLASVSSTPNTPVSGLARVQVDVETPAQAAAANRSKYTFVTLMQQ